MSAALSAAACRCQGPVEQLPGVGEALLDPVDLEPAAVAVGT